MAKRVNTPFLIGLTSAVVLIAVGFIAVNFLSGRRHRSPAGFIKAGDAAYAAKHYDEAIQNYNKALGLDRSSKDLLLKRGDALNQITEQVPEALRAARQSWEDALVVDPKFMPAMQRLLQSYAEEMEINPQNEVLSHLHDVASQITKLAPDDAAAQQYLAVATIQQSLAGQEQPTHTMDEAIATLGSLMAKNPANPDLPYYLARAKMQRAVDLRKYDQPEDADTILVDVASMYAGALKSQEKNAAMNFRAFLIYQALSQLDRNKKRSDADKAASEAALARARAAGTPADPLYDDIQFAASDQAQLAGKPEESEKILRALYVLRPDDQFARIALARLLASVPAKREEAIAILSKPVVSTGNTGARGTGLRNAQARTLFDLISDRCDMYAASDDPAKKKMLLDLVQRNVKQLAELSGGESIPVLRQKALVQTIQGDNVGAIQIYTRALALMDRPGTKDYDLIFQAARAEAQAGQNRSAEKLLQEFLDRYDASIPARVLLSQLLLAEHRIDEARRQIDVLEQLRPNATEVLQLRVAQLTGESKPDEAAKFYVRLPEEKHIEKLAKAQTAVGLNNYAEAARLLEAARTETPDDTGITLGLAEVYSRLQNKDQAAGVIADALKLHPKDPRLLIVQQRLQNATPEQIEKLNKELLASSDAFTREVSAFQDEAGQSHFDEALKHLRAAEAMKPDSRVIWELYYQFFVQQKRYDDAERAVDALARLDADQAGGLLYRARLAKERGDHAGAIRFAGELAQKLPEFAQSWVTLGDAYKDNQQFADALREYRTALEKQSNNFDALRGEADCLFALHQPDRAKEVIDEARGFFPESPVFREMSLNYDLAYGSPEKVIPQREDMLKKSPEQPASYIALAEACYRASQTRADDPARSKQYLARAEEVLTQAQTRFADPANSRPIVGALAQVMQARGDFAGGEQVLLKFAGLPEWAAKPEPALMLADYYALASKTDATEKYLREALAKSPEKDKPANEQRLAALLSREGRYPEALTVLGDNQVDPGIVRQRIEIYLASRDVGRAQKAVQDALAREPNAHDLLNKLAAVYIEMGKYDDASTVTKQVIATDPKNDDALYYQGLNEMRRPGGDIDLAVKSLILVRDDNPQNVQVRLLLAEAYRRRNDPENGARELEQALLTAPQNREVRLRLADLYATTIPPRWNQFDKILHEAEADSHLQSDPTWLATEARALSIRGQHDLASEKIHAAMKLAPDNIDLIGTSLTLLLNAKNYAGLLADTDQLLASGKSEWWVYRVRGIARADTGDLPGAMAEFEKGLAAAEKLKNDDAAEQVVSSLASKAGPDEALKRVHAFGRADPRWAILAAALYEQKQDWASAIRELEPLRTGDAIFSREQKAGVLRSIAQCYQAQKKPELAREAYTQLLATLPGDLAALNNLAFLLADDLHDPQQAKAYSQQAYQATEKSGAPNPTIADTHGWVLTLCGGLDAGEGMRILEGVVENSPNFLDARYHLAEAYIRKALADLAAEQCTTALNQIKELDDKKVAVDPQLRANFLDALTRAKQLSAKSEAAVH